MNEQMTTCKSTGEQITIAERDYRDEKRNSLIIKLQEQLGKTRQQVLALFRLYSPKTTKENKL